MPLTKLICPHCETNVELQVTSVTRTRDCPNCGRAIVLQFDTKVTGEKRRALLTGSREVSQEEILQARAAELEIRSLEGDVHKRMMLDPEVRSSAKQLRMGIYVVLGLVAVLMAGHWLRWWPWLNGGAEGNKGREVKVLAEQDKFRPEYVQQDRGGKERSTAAGTVVLTGNEALDAALKRAKMFLDAKNVDERLELVRDRNLMENKIRAYYKNYPDGPIAFERIYSDQPDATGSRFTLNVVLPSGGTRQMMLGTPRNGEATVDWASFVVYSDIAWDEWVKNKPVEPHLLRVLAATDVYYGGDFSDADSLGCVKLFDPLKNDSKPVFAYYEKSTSVGREMDFVMRQSGGQALQLTLTLRYPADAKTDNQVWVEERVAEGWMAKGR